MGRRSCASLHALAAAPGPAYSFQALPYETPKATSVVVIHENRGLTASVKSVGDRLAANGFAAICPDFLSGMGPSGGATDSFSSSDDARDALRTLDTGQVMSDLQTVVRHQCALTSTGENVAVVGFCWGGAQAFRLATIEPSLVAAFVFYGRPPEPEAMAAITCPVYGFYGESDERINATIDETKASMAAAGKTFEPVIYPGVGHAFLRGGTSDDASKAQKDATRQAWARFIRLLDS